ncbi:hypothetical protein GCM10009844_42000 [Nocardioides koreensis]|uniref:DUF4185 domain-containing protein n=1 Tax=Nocardioides koreensis TaxID=433651 RepID=A0ABP5M1W0_9ACTN
MTSRARGAVVLAAGLALLLGGCTGSDGTDKSPRPGNAVPHLAPRCPPPPAHRTKPTVAELNKLGASVDLPGWQAGDIGASGRLSDGRLVWLFGDTTRTKLEPPIVANSMLVSSGRCVSQLVTKEKGPVIPDVSPNVVRWPMSVAVGRSQGHDVVLVLCSRIDRGHSGSFGFTFLGTTAAVFTVEDGQAPQPDKVVDITPDSRNQEQVNWGAASTVHGRWFYVYGTRLTGQQYDFGRELYLARTPAADPGNRKRWQVWDGSGWSSKPPQAVAVLPSQGGVSQTLSVDSLGGQWVAVSKRDGDISDFVYKWTAPNPWGPWTPVKELKAPGGFDTGNLKYAPLAHPEVPLKSGDLLVSISRNTTDLQRLLKDPEIGRPEFVALPR